MEWPTVTNKGISWENLRIINITVIKSYVIFENLGNWTLHKISAKTKSLKKIT